MRAHARPPGGLRRVHPSRRQDTYLEHLPRNAGRPTPEGTPSQARAEPESIAQPVSDPIFEPRTNDADIVTAALLRQVRAQRRSSGQVDVTDL